MSSFMERAFYSFRKYPDRVALQDDNRSYTFRELDEISGKVYSWLKNNGIGAEDFVQIVMPREIDAIAVMFGVIRSGAAFAIMEDFFPEQRVEFIRKDINAKCLINSDKFAQIVMRRPILIRLHSPYIPPVPQECLREFSMSTETSIFSRRYFLRLMSIPRLPEP